MMRRGKRGSALGCILSFRELAQQAFRLLAVPSSDWLREHESVMTPGLLGDVVCIIVMERNWVNDPE